METARKRIATESALLNDKKIILQEKKTELESYICPITQSVFENPYNTACCGIDFEKSALDTWYSSNTSCPLNRCSQITSINDCNPSTATRGKIISLKEDIDKYTKEIITIKEKINKYKHMLFLFANPENSKINASVSSKTDMSSNTDFYCIKTYKNDEDDQSIGISIDTSASMGTTNTITVEGETKTISNLEIVKQSAGMICKQLCNIKRKVFIIRFGRKIETIAEPDYITNDNIDIILQKISNMNPEGDTNMIGSIEQSFEFIKNMNMTNLIILTDGVPTFNYTSAYMKPNRARPGTNLSGIDSATFDLIEEYNLQDKVRIHMIGLGKNLERESLLDITDKTGGNYYYMFDFGMIPHVTTHILFNILNKCCNSSYATFTYEKEITEDNMKLITKYLDLYNYSVNKNVLTINFGSLNNNKEIVFKLDNTIKPVNYVFKCITKNDTKYTLPIEENNFDIECHSMRLNMAQALSKYQSQLYNELIDTTTLKPLMDELIIQTENYAVNEDNKDYQTALVKDLKDQIYIGFTESQHLNVWGHLHNAAAIRNHFHMMCSNFVQEGEQFYKTLSDKKYLQKLNKAWVNFELPEPKRVSYNYSQESSVRYRSMSASTSIATPSAPVQLTRSFSEAISTRVQNDGCIHEDCQIWISPNKTVKASEIKKNMIIFDDDGNEAVVECVTKMKCTDGMCCMSIYEDVALTPYHPIVPKYTDKKDDDEWYFPLDLVVAENIKCEYIYNYVLSTRGSIYAGENRIKVCTLAHGINKPRVEHGFFGTEDIVENLKNEFTEEYDKGLIDNIGYVIRSKNTGRIIEYKK